MASVLETRLSRLEQTEANAEAMIHFFTIKSPEDEAEVRTQTEKLSPNAVVFITLYEPRPAAVAGNAQQTIGACQ